MGIGRQVYMKASDFVEHIDRVMACGLYLPTSKTGQAVLISDGVFKYVLLSVDNQKFVSFGMRPEEFSMAHIEDKTEMLDLLSYCHTVGVSYAVIDEKRIAVDVLLHFFRTGCVKSNLDSSVAQA